jgi:hypothetical protein
MDKAGDQTGLGPCPISGIALLAEGTWNIAAKVFSRRV